MTEGFIYQGKELSLFENANNWKKYFTSVIQPYIKGNVLEVGAGIGANLTWILTENVKKLTLLEPDEKMCSALQRKITETGLENIEVIKGTIETINSLQYDTIVYIDVLEHIHDDKSELQKACSLLKNDGHLIVLSPAFQWLYTEFDKAIGHYRRYDQKTLRKVISLNPLSEKKIIYLDSIGFFASLMNKLFLRQNYPTAKQVSLWDSWMIPVSKFTDKLFFHSFGKSIIGLWQKENGK